MRHGYTRICFLTISLLTMHQHYYSADSAKTSVSAMLLAGRIDMGDPSAVKAVKIVNGEDLADNDYPTIFTTAPHLESLTIQKHKFVNPAPTYAQYLKILNLSRGTLAQFRLAEHLAQLSVLEELNLSHNNLTTIGYEADVKETQMGSKREYNEGKYYWISVWEHGLQKLDVSHNNLSIFNMHLLNQLPKLQIADYSHNAIQTVVTLPTPSLQHGKYRKRVTTQVLLQNNQISGSALIGCDSDLAPTYRDRLDNYGAWLFCVGTGLGAIVSFGIGAHLEFALPDGLMHTSFGRPTPFPKYVLGIGFGGSAAGAAFIGAPLYAFGRGVVRCMTPKSEQYVQVFDFVFDTQDSAVQLEANEKNDDEEYKLFV